MKVCWQGSEWPTLAIDKGKTVAWHTLETLAQLLRRHRADDSINKAIGKLIRESPQICARARAVREHNPRTLH